MYQEVCFNRGTEAGGGVNVGHSLSPSSHFMLATGLSRERNLYWNESQKETTCLVISKIGNCQQSIQ